MDLTEQLTRVEERFEELDGLMADPGVLSDYARVSELAQERSNLERLVDAWRRYQDLQGQLSDNRALLAESDDPEVVGALVEAGYVGSVAEAFGTWLGDGKPAHITRDRLTPAEAIALLHEAGGAVFVAHPIYLGDDYEERVAELTRMGLDGIETYYKFYDAETIAAHEALSEKLGLARSGGSDYHGLGNPNDREIGDIPFEDGAVAEFVAFLEERAVPGLAQAGAS